MKPFLKTIILVCAFILAFLYVRSEEEKATKKSSYNANSVTATTASTDSVKMTVNAKNQNQLDRLYNGMQMPR